jgi:hypothetical protein
MRSALKRMRRTENADAEAIENPLTREPETTEAAPAAESTTGKEGAAPAKINGATKSKGVAKISMWDYLDDPARDSDGSFVILYRLLPIISKSDNRHYIDRRYGRLTPQDILDQHGSGRYDVYCKGANRELLYRDQISVHNAAHPPKVNMLELVKEHPDNQSFFEIWGKSSGNTSDKNGASASDMNSVNSVLTTVLEKAGSFDPKLAALWEQTAQQRDELSKALAQKNAPPDFAAQAKALKEVFPTLFAPPPSPPPAAPQQLDAIALLKAMKELQPEPQDPIDPIQLLEQAKNLFAAPAGAAENRNGDEIDRLDKVLGFAQKLAALRVHSGERSGWEVGLDYTRELLSPLTQLAQTWMLSRTGRMPPGTVPNAAAPAAAGPFDPYANPQAMRDHARAMNQSRSQTPPTQPPPATPETAPPSNSANSQAGSAPDELLPLLQNYGTLLLNALNSGMPGYDFADHLSQLFGTATQAMIAARGEDSLTQTLLSIREFAVFGEVRLRRFVSEFIHFEEILTEEQAAAAANE